jgi:hypothetical protein
MGNPAGVLPLSGGVAFEERYSVISEAKLSLVTRCEGKMAGLGAFLWPDKIGVVVNQENQPIGIRRRTSLAGTTHKAVPDESKLDKAAAERFQQAVAGYLVGRVVAHVQEGEDSQMLRPGRRLNRRLNKIPSKAYSTQNCQNRRSG